VEKTPLEKIVFPLESLGRGERDHPVGRTNDILGRLDWGGVMEVNTTRMRSDR
jgi:hypothetical protein